MILSDFWPHARPSPPQVLAFLRCRFPEKNLFLIIPKASK